MIDIFEKKYRITEEIDYRGVSTFIPERTILGIWFCYSGYLGAIEFYKEAGAKEFIKMLKYKTIKIRHNYGE